MNAVGIAMVGTFLIGCVGAATSWLALRQLTNPPDRNGDRAWDKSDPEARRRFRTFVGFCAVGVLSGIVGFLFGNWPQ
jgi:hypothetical protein